jgi:hypothetical protein
MRASSGTRAAANFLFSDWAGPVASRVDDAQETEGATSGGSQLMRFVGRDVNRIHPSD